MIITATYKGAIDTGECGGKGANLLLLQREGYNVPPFVLLTDSYFAQHSNILQPDDLDYILAQLGCDTLLAVRSSASVEDSHSQSYAGQFTSLLNINAEALPEAIQQVRAATQSAAVAAYQAHTGKAAQISMAVIIQQMVPATAAGVAFGADPLTGDTSKLVVNAVPGLGNKLVDGAANADSYEINKASGKVSSRLIGNQALLSDTQINTVAATLRSLEQLMGKPQDIEFAFAGDQFYLLQSRPITTLQARQPKIIWDNSNIIESYPGLTLPLTFSFILKMYEAVYRQLSGVFGVSRKKIAANSAVYAQMLGLLNGRVYYQLNNWYRALAQLPGYNLNAGFMEQMMGVKDKPDFEESFGSTKAGWRDYLDIASAIIAILRNLLTANKQRLQFIRDFDTIYKQFESKDYSQLSLQELLDDYQRFETLMVQKWKAPLVNDFFAMIYFGSLQKICTQAAPESANLHNRLIAGAGDIITTEPMKQLFELIAQITERPELLQAAQAQTAAELWQLLQQPAYKKEHARIAQYINVWGERTVAELKLETITYYQDPVLLLSILQSYIRQGITSYAGQDNTAKERVTAESLMEHALTGKPFKKLIYRHVLRQARYFVSNRENLRYYRTRGFGMVRRMMLAAGEHLFRKGYIDDARDVFYLQLQELQDSSMYPQLKAVATARRKDYALFEQLQLPQRVASRGMPEKIILSGREEAQPGAQTDILQGLPCAAGTVHAKVRLLRQADELTSLDGAIMATYATDPGWVVLFPSASAVITERGSLLSHAAIVCREMGIPCIVGVEGLMSRLKDGDELIIDGNTGIIKIIVSCPGS